MQSKEHCLAVHQGVGVCWCRALALAADLRFRAALEEGDLISALVALYVLRTVNSASTTDPVGLQKMPLQPTVLDFLPEEFFMYIAGLWDGDGCVCLWQTVEADELVSAKVRRRLGTNALVPASVHAPSVGGSQTTPCQRMCALQ